MKEYKKFEVYASPLNIDLISGILWQLDISGINEEENKIIVFAENESSINKREITGQLEKLKSNNLLESYSVSEFSLEDKNWNEEWEKTIDVIEITERIVIKPSFRDYTPKPKQIILEIDPKMSFGTGEHQTTKLVVKLLEKYTADGQHALDVGSGTGILSIAAIKLGAEKVIAIDNDEWCSENGLENVKANNCEKQIDIRLGEINDIEENNFDLITANINKHILLDIGKQLTEKMVEDGILILSGILLQDKEDILNCYTSFGVKLIDSVKMDEWLALVLKK